MKKLRKFELLAPAGDKSAFLAAVENGADAVYLGGTQFNARQSAGNFDEETLKWALNYAHVRDVKVYLAMNTLLNNDEIEMAFVAAGKAWQNGVDAVIVQDLGFASLLRNALPELPLHASTQMTSVTKESAAFLENMGFSRVVAARELSLKELKKISDSTKLELEVFCHGALCISYSGQCLMSSMIGGRSGNRGSCAQPCRQRYELLKNANDIDQPLGSKKDSFKADYLLSPKDLSAIEIMADMIRSGVHSFKIEGRLKSAEYVATVTRIYRKYLDLSIELVENGGVGNVKIVDEDIHQLYQAFNRGGFTKGYLEGKKDKSIMSPEKPKNWGIHIGEAVMWDKTKRLVKVKLNKPLSMGDGVEFWTGNDHDPGNIVTRILHNKQNSKVAEPGGETWIGYIESFVPSGAKLYKTSDKSLNEEAERSYSGKSNRKSTVFGELNLKTGENPLLKLWDETGIHFEQKGERPVEKAMNKPMDPERVREQMQKTGDTPFKFQVLTINCSNDGAIAISDLNALRRNAFEGFEKEKLMSYSRGFDTKKMDNLLTHIKKANHIKKEILLTNNPELGFTQADKYENKLTILDKLTSEYELKLEKVTPTISVLVYRADYLKVELFQNMRIYIGLNELRKVEEATLIALKVRNNQLFIKLDGHSEEILRITVDFIDQLKDMRLIDGVLLSNLGQLELFKTIEKFKRLQICTDAGINVYNQFTAEMLKTMGVTSALVSPELTLEKIAEISNASPVNTEMIIYGRIPVMTTAYCQIGKGLCNNSETNDEMLSNVKNIQNPVEYKCSSGLYSLKDKKNCTFPIIANSLDCSNTILSASSVNFLSQAKKMLEENVNIFRLCFYDEEIDEVKKVLKKVGNVLINKNI